MRRIIEQGMQQGFEPLMTRRLPRSSGPKAMSAIRSEERKKSAVAQKWRTTI